jgi:hypothetical protein
VLRAEGRETRGQGNANATITATLTADGDGTAVSVVTDLTVTGRVAQFGRGVLADVSAKLLDQFVACLESTVLSDAPAPPASSSRGGSEGTSDGDSAPAGPSSPGAEPAAAEESATANAAPTVTGSDAPSGPSAVPAPAATGSSGARRIDHPEAQPVDLIGAAGTPVAKRVGPVLAAVAIFWLLKKLLGRRR